MWKKNQKFPPNLVVMPNNGFLELFVLVLLNSKWQYLNLEINEQYVCSSFPCKERLYTYTNGSKQNVTLCSFIFLVARGQLNLICITDLSLVVWVLNVDCENRNQKQGQRQRTKVFWAVVKTTTSVKSFSEFFISFSQPLLWFKVLETLVRPKNFMTTSVSLLSFFFPPSPTEVWKTAQFPLTRCQNQRQEES